MLRTPQRSLTKKFSDEPRKLGTVGRKVRAGEADKRLLKWLIVTKPGCRPKTKSLVQTIHRCMKKQDPRLTGWMFRLAPPPRRKCVGYVLMATTEECVTVGLPRHLTWERFNEDSAEHRRAEETFDQISDLRLGGNLGLLYQAVRGHSDQPTVNIDARSRSRMKVRA